MSSMYACHHRRFLRAVLRSHACPRRRACHRCHGWQIMPTVDDFLDLIFAFDIIFQVKASPLACGPPAPTFPVPLARRPTLRQRAAHTAITSPAPTPMRARLPLSPSVCACTCGPWPWVYMHVHLPGPVATHIPPTRLACGRDAKCQTTRSFGLAVPRAHSASAATTTRAANGSPSSSFGWSSLTTCAPGSSSTSSQPSPLIASSPPKTPQLSSARLVSSRPFACSSSVRSAPAALLLPPIATSSHPLAITTPLLTIGSRELALSLPRACRELAPSLVTIGSPELAACQVRRVWLPSSAGRIMRKWNALSYGPVLKVRPIDEAPMTVNGPPNEVAMGLDAPR